MRSAELIRRVLAEFLGAVAIVATVVSSGYLVEIWKLDALPRLIFMALAIGMALFVLINILLPISGAHFNPAVTLVLALQQRIRTGLGTLYVIAQTLGAVIGAAVANLVFAGIAFEFSDSSTANPANSFGEVLATFGLLLIILMLSQANKLSLIPGAVAIWIIAGHFLTFAIWLANPAVTVGRVFTANITSVSWNAALLFIPLQILGALFALGIFQLFMAKNKKEQRV